MVVMGVVTITETLKSGRGWVGRGLEGELCDLTQLGPSPVSASFSGHLGSKASLNLTFLIGKTGIIRAIGEAQGPVGWALTPSVLLRLWGISGPSVCPQTSSSRSNWLVA